jgi:hypothetical protein
MADTDTRGGEEMTDPRVSRAAESDRAVYNSAGTINNTSHTNTGGGPPPVSTPRTTSASDGQPGTRPYAAHEMRLSRTVPVASFQAYADAEAAVHQLAEAAFPIERTTIVGCDLRLIEQVTGRLTAARATGLGAASGAWIGLLVGLLLAVFTSYTVGGFFAILLFAIVVGAIFGAILVLVSYFVADRYRGFTSDRLILASRYDLHAEPEIVDPLRNQLLQRRPAGMALVST